MPKYLPPENIYGKGSNVSCTDDKSFWTDYCTINVSFRNICTYLAVGMTFSKYEYQVKTLPYSNNSIYYLITTGIG